jgi:hypothetical protein
MPTAGGGPAVGTGAGLSAVELPTLTEIRNWDTSHLDAAARQWESTAEGWESSFAVAYQEAASPGGTEWEGQAAEATRARCLTDLYTVRGLADTLAAAARVSRTGAADLEFAKQQVLDSVRRAQEAGFDVHDDLSLSTRDGVTADEYPAKLAEGQRLSAEINARALRLAQLDAEIAGKITAAVAPLGTVRFHEAPIDVPAPGDGTVQFVDFKQGPDLSPTPEPGAGGGREPHPTIPGRDSRGRFTDGNTGSADGAAAAEARIQAEERDTGLPFVRQQIRVAVIDPKTGRPMLDLRDGTPIYRYYDALKPTSDPNKFIGIEVKSGSAELTRRQEIFDGWVRDGHPATGVLNGIPIEIVGAEELRAPRHVPGQVPVADPDQAPRAGQPAPLPPDTPRPEYRGPFRGTYIPPEVLAKSDDPVLRSIGQELLAKKAEEARRNGTYDPNSMA